MAITLRITQPGVTDAPRFFPYERFVVAPGRAGEAARYRRRAERRIRNTRIVTWVLGSLTGLAVAIWFFVSFVMTAKGEDMIFGMYAAAGILITVFAITAMVDCGIHVVLADKAEKDVRSRHDLFRDASGLSQFSQTVDLSEQQLWDVALDIINLENARKVADWQCKSIPTRNLTRAAQADRQALHRALQRRAAAIAETLDPTPPFTSSDKGGN